MPKIHPLIDSGPLLRLVCPSSPKRRFSRLGNEPIAAATSCGPPIRQLDRNEGRPLPISVHDGFTPPTPGWLGFHNLHHLTPERAIRYYLQVVAERFDTEPAFHDALSALHGRLIGCPHIHHPVHLYVTTPHAAVCPALSLHRFLRTALGDPFTDPATPHVQPPVETSVNDECPGCGLDAAHCHCFD